MRIFTRTVTVVLFISMIIGINRVQAQNESKWTSGNSFAMSFPMDNMGDIYDMGYGIYANFDYNLSSFLAARFDLGWNHFSGADALKDLSALNRVWLTKFLLLQSTI